MTSAYRKSEKRKAYDRLKARRYLELHRDEVNQKKRARRKRNPLYWLERELQRDPLKFPANRKVRTQVQLGKIKKPTHCEECLEPSVILHGHHEDYSKPLEVQWLCPKCHGKRHRVYV